MNFPDPIVEWCRAQGFGTIKEAVPQGGGCIHACYRLRTEDGRSLFSRSMMAFLKICFCEADD
jgi:hypothetical protein